MLVFGSTNQFMKFLPNLASLGSLLKALLNKKSILFWSDDHTIAFEKIISKNVNLAENTHFVMKLSTRVKSDTLDNGLGATFKQLNVNDWRSVFIR